MMITQLNTGQADFQEKFSEKIKQQSSNDENITSRVQQIISDVRAQGDQALLHYTKKFDQCDQPSVSALTISKNQLAQAYENLKSSQKEALLLAAKRIEDYHQKQILSDWSYQDDTGTQLGQKITPLDSVGLYVPGGQAAYPSSVLMNAIPAKVARVKRVVMTVPTPNNQVNQLVLAAAHLADINEVYTIGGAQAIAALAYGTQTINAVDKIFGPGNAYVATAKRLVFGQVGIDMIAGPSEIVIICDDKTNPDWLAMDLFSQAEHDADARAILLSPKQNVIDAVKESINKLLPTLKRQTIISKSLQKNGLLICTKNLNEAVQLSNQIAPEHLELSVEKPESLLTNIRHAGAIFMGRYSSESLGDYCAGPNHVLPTSGTARFSSPLGVYDFQKRSSLIYASKDSAKLLGKVAETLAHCEGFQAHALAAKYRF